MDELLGVELRNAPTRVPGVARMSVLNIDPDNASEAYRRRVIELMGPSASETERSTVREQLPYGRGGHADHAPAVEGTEHGAHDKHAGHSVAIFRDRFWLSLTLTILTLVWGTVREPWSAGFASDRPKAAAGVQPC